MTVRALKYFFFKNIQTPNHRQSLSKSGRREKAASFQKNDKSKNFSISIKTGGSGKDRDLFTKIIFRDIVIEMHPSINNYAMYIPTMACS